ncbi:MAG TPA: ABC transporter permease [Candidatus Acidoferrum sp.]|nr:ABC transporter permease [Candidatus Acidoferrum sp.]
MRLWSQLRSWSRANLRRARTENEMDTELKFHMDAYANHLVRSGVPPKEAMRRARLEFGGVERAKEECRDATGVSLVQSLVQDIRYGLRMLRNNLGFTAIAVLSLALGIGANTAIFTLIDAVMLRMLPVKNPQELVSLKLAPDTQFPREAPDGDRSIAFPYPAFVRMRDHNQALSALFAFRDTGSVSVLANGSAGIAHGQLVTSNYVSSLGVRTVLGRDFVPQDDITGAQPVAIISYGYWQSHFAGEPSVLGRRIVVNGTPMTIIGVAAPEFFGLQPGSAVDLYMPMAMQPQIVPNVAGEAPGTSVFAATDVWWIQLMGRLKPGVNAEQARANLDVIYRPTVLQGLHPEAGRGPLVPPALEVVPAGGGLGALRNAFSKPLAILMIVVGIVLLIACVNMANLLLVRSAARAKEIAVRLSLGASRLRLIRQLLLESVLLSTFGGLLGLIFAYWGCSALVAMMQHGNNPLVIGVHPDLNVLGFTALACLLTGVLFGLAPALRATRVELTPALKQTAGSLGTTREKMYTAKSLVVAQVSLSVVLLFGAGLFVRTLVNLETMNVGFSRDNLLLFGISPKHAGYEGQHYADLCREIQSHLAQLPGVKSASSSLLLLLDGNLRVGMIKVPGYTPRPDEKTIAFFLPVGGDFLSTMGIPLLRGRDLSPRDDENAAKVALINDKLARKYWPHENPLGRHFKLRDVDLEVVGIVGDAKYRNLRGDIPPTVYFPYVQQMDSMPQVHFEVRTQGDAKALIPSVRAVVASIDNRLPLHDVRTQTQQIDDLLYQERLFAKLVGFFAMLALALVSVGLYGVMSYSVARRTSEIGIRMALGAQRRNIVAMVLRATMLLVGFGLVLGVIASFAMAKIASHEVAGLLYGLKVTDTASIWLAIAFIALVAAAASFVPVRRAMRVDPMVALRHE